MLKIFAFEHRNLKTSHVNEVLLSTVASHLQQFEPGPHQTGDDARIVFVQKQIVRAVVRFIQFLFPNGNFRLLISGEKRRVDRSDDATKNLFRWKKVSMWKMFVFVEERRGEVQPGRLLLVRKRLQIFPHEDWRTAFATIDRQENRVHHVAGAQTDQTRCTDENDLNEKRKIEAKTNDFSRRRYSRNPFEDCRVASINERLLIPQVFFDRQFLR